MLRLGTAANDRVAIARAFDAVGELLAATGHPSAAVGLSSSATALREELGVQLVPLDSTRLGRWLTGAQLALGTDCEAVIAAGRARPLATAVEEALAACTRPQVAHEPPAQAEPPESFGRLTRREREIAGLLARGHTNRQSADTLVISEQTVETHVKRILGKIDVRSRHQVADIAGLNIPT